MAIMEVIQSERLIESLGKSFLYHLLYEASNDQLKFGLVQSDFSFL